MQRKEEKYLNSFCNVSMRYNGGTRFCDNSYGNKIPFYNRSSHYAAFYSVTFNKIGIFDFNHRSPRLYRGTFRYFLDTFRFERFYNSFLGISENFNRDYGWEPLSAENEIIFNFKRLLFLSKRKKRNNE